MNDTDLKGAPTGNRWRRALLTAALLVAFAIVLVGSAWMSDDTYITLRAVDNLVNGYGPTWNVAEHVQSFTHPLWMLVLSVAYFVTREAYFTTIALGIALSLGALLVLVTRLARTPLAAAAGAGVLILSKAFVDYATSGLENALTYFLLACFFAFDLRTTARGAGCSGWRCSPRSSAQPDGRGALGPAVAVAGAGSGVVVDAAEPAPGNCRAGAWVGAASRVGSIFRTLLRLPGAEHRLRQTQHGHRNARNAQAWRLVPPAFDAHRFLHIALPRALGIVLALWKGTARTRAIALGAVLSISLISSG